MIVGAMSRMTVHGTIAITPNSGGSAPSAASSGDVPSRKGFCILSAQNARHNLRLRDPKKGEKEMPENELLEELLSEIAQHLDNCYGQTKGVVSSANGVVTLWIYDRTFVVRVEESTD